MVLANPLTKKMIEEAEKIHQQFHGWQTSDNVLVMLRDSFPGFSFEEILLKATVINSLYGTNVLAIWKVAEHVCQTIPKYDLDSVGAEFVEKIAKVPDIKTKSGKDREFISFASKFTHFFIDQERFPIMDQYAKCAIKYHLGCNEWEKCPDKPYQEFVVNFMKLKDLCSFKGSVRDFDHYIWLAGLFQEWEKKNNKAKFNQEVKSFFGNPKNKEIIRRAFKGEL